MTITAVLTVPPWLAGAEPAGVLWGKAVCRFYALGKGRRHVPVRTEVSATRTAVPGGIEILDAAIRAALADLGTERVVVISGSLGSVIASGWLDTHGRQDGRPDPARLRFVLLANPVRGVAHGAARCDRFNGAPVQPTPTDTDYIVDDVARFGDKYAFPAGKPSSGAHSNYFMTNLDTLQKDSVVPVERVGRAAFWVVPLTAPCSHTVPIHEARVARRGRHLGGGRRARGRRRVRRADLRATRNADPVVTLTVPLVSRGNGRWGSPSAAWDHLINRESSGIPDIVQSPAVVDVNTGGNEAEGLFQITPRTWRGAGGTEFAPSARLATPQQQAIVAARIFTRNPSGSDWGAGRAGRESARDLAAGLVPLDSTQPAQEPAVPDHPKRPPYNAIENWTKNQSSRGGVAIDCVFIHTQEPAPTPSMAFVNDGALNLSKFIRSTEGGPNPVSYHTVASQNLNDKGVTVVYCADTDNKSWSVGDSNPRSLNYCFGGSFSGWTTEQWIQQSGAIDAIAWEIVADLIKYGQITKDKRPPVDWSTNYAHNPPVVSDHRYCTVKLRDGNNHTDVDNGRGTFPWKYFEGKYNEYADIQLGITSTPAPDPTPVPQPVKRFPQDYSDRELAEAVAVDVREIRTQLGAGLDVWGLDGDLGVNAAGQRRTVRAALAALIRKVGA